MANKQEVDDSLSMLFNEIFGFVKKRTVEMSPRVIFYPRKEGRGLHNSPRTDLLNSMVVGKSSAVILGWKGPQKTKVLRVPMCDPDGKLWALVCEHNSGLYNLNVEVMIGNHPTGYIRSADRFRITTIDYDTLERNEGCDETDVKAYRDRIVVDFHIEHNQIVDDKPYIQKYLDDNPTVMHVEDLRISSYEMMRKFYKLMVENNVPLNHPHQFTKALEMPIVKTMIENTLNKRKGE